MSAERRFALEVVEKLRAAGHQALWAGGCVRDQLLGLAPTDYDVATDATPAKVRKVFRRTIEVGASFGVVEVLGPRHERQFLKVQVAAFRTEGPYSDGRRPDRVEFSTPEADAQRRDFTINGMFYDPIGEEVIDYVGGRSDLDAKCLRAIGDPSERFAEDKLRLIRAVRFAARFDLTIEPSTFAALQSMAGQITVVSAERICDELRKTLLHPRRAQAMTLLVEAGLVPPLLPELLPVATSPQWQEILDALSRLSHPSYSLGLATLLAEIDFGTANHICLRLRMSNSDRERVVWLVQNRNILNDINRMKLSRLKPLLANDGIRDLIALHRAYALARKQSLDPVDHAERLLSTWSKEEINPPPLITGQDLIDLHLDPGPLFKQLLDEIRAAQLEGTLRTTAHAIAYVKQKLESQ